MMWELFNDVMLYVDGMNRAQWLVVAVVAVVIGAFWMRGFGSRSSY